MWDNTLDIILAGGYLTSEGKVIEIEGTDSMLNGTKVYKEAYDVSDKPFRLDIAIAFACAAKPSRKSPLGKLAPFGEYFGFKQNGISLHLTPHHFRL